MTIGTVASIAIVDDEESIRSALHQMLELEGFTPLAFANAESALAHIDAGFEGIVIADLRMPGLDGGGFFNRLMRCDPELPVIMMSGHSDIATAVDLVRRGAYDFLSKPFDGDVLIASVRRALEKRALVLENRRLRDLPLHSAISAIGGESREIERLRHTLSQLAQADIDVMITGESGTGKSLVATSLHRRSLRARKAMITVDCGALPSDQAESLFFGHVSGAFAGAQFPRSGQLLLANEGTLCLDHVDGLPRALQSRILQSLEDRSILPVGATQMKSSSFRTISCTSANMEALMAAGDFDRSLYFRLGAFRLDIPPLRARRGDAIILFRAFLVEASAELGREPPALSPRIWQRLQDYHWPGNVRELRSFAATVALGIGDDNTPVQPTEMAGSRASLREALAAYEASIIRDILGRNGGDVAASIAALQLPRKTFYDKLTRHAINPNLYRTANPRRD